MIYSREQLIREMVMVTRHSARHYVSEDSMYYATARFVLALEAAIGISSIGVPFELIEIESYASVGGNGETLGWWLIDGSVWLCSRRGVGGPRVSPPEKGSYLFTIRSPDGRNTWLVD